MHADKLYQVLDACINVYNHASHTVTEIWCDQQFSTIMDTAKDDLGMHMNYTDSGDQKPISEHNNCMVKYHIISIFHSLLFRMISNIMVKKLATIENKHLNWFPFKCGISPYYSPHVIMDGLPIYYENHY